MCLRYLPLFQKSFLLLTWMFKIRIHFFVIINLDNRNRTFTIYYFTYYIIFHTRNSFASLAPPHWCHTFTQILGKQLFAKDPTWDRLTYTNLWQKHSSAIGAVCLQPGQGPRFFNFSHSPAQEVKALSQAWQQFRKMKQYCRPVPSPEVPIKTANICKTIHESVHSS